MLLIFQLCLQIFQQIINTKKYVYHSTKLSLKVECKLPVSPSYVSKHISLQTVKLYFRKPSMQKWRTHEGLVQAVDCTMFKEDSFNQNTKDLIVISRLSEDSALHNTNASMRCQKLLLFFSLGWSLIHTADTLLDILTFTETFYQTKITLHATYSPIA